MKETLKGTHHIISDFKIINKELLIKKYDGPFYDGGNGSPIPHYNWKSFAIITDVNVDNEKAEKYFIKMIMAIVDN